MTLNPEQAFNVMLSAYQGGVLNKIMVIQGRAVEIVLEKTGYTVEDLLIILDEVDEADIMMVDKMLEQHPLLYKLTALGPLMKMASRILERKAVKNYLANKIARVILKAINREDVINKDKKIVTTQI